MTTQGKLNNGKVISYAKGLMIGSHKGLKTIEHGGRAPGYQSNIVRFPDEKFTVIILSNSSNIDPNRMADKIAEIFLKDEFLNPVQKPLKKRKAKKLSKKPLEKFAGSYWSIENSIARKISHTNDTLRYERSRGRSHALLPINKTDFKMLGTPKGMEVIVRFNTNESKKGMTFIENGSVVDTWEHYQPVTYSSEELVTFVGKYYSKEIDTYYEFRMEKNNRLLLFINGTPTVPLRPIKKNFFASPIGVFQFSVNKIGQAASFRVSTPRVKDVLFVKS